MLDISICRFNWFGGDEPLQDDWVRFIFLPVQDAWTILFSEAEAIIAYIRPAQGNHVMLSPFVAVVPGWGGGVRRGWFFRRGWVGVLEGGGV